MNLTYHQAQALLTHIQKDGPVRAPRNSPLSKAITKLKRYATGRAAMERRRKYKTAQRIKQLEQACSSTPGFTEDQCEECNQNFFTLGSCPYCRISDLGFSYDDIKTSTPSRQAEHVST